MVMQIVIVIVLGIVIVIDGHAMDTKYVFNAASFREERMLQRSRKRLEALQCDQFFDRFVISSIVSICLSQTTG